MVITFSIYPGFSNYDKLSVWRDRNTRIVGRTNHIIDVIGTLYRRIAYRKRSTVGCGYGQLDRFLISRCILPGKKFDDNCMLRRSQDGFSLIAVHRYLFAVYKQAVLLQSFYRNGCFSALGVRYAERSQMERILLLVGKKLGCTHLLALI